MPRPFHLNITHVACHSTNDYTGSDDLVGLMGPRRFTIGSFVAGRDLSLEISELVPTGELYLTILEADTLGSDDEIGTIDLSRDMDTDRRVNVQGGDASYDVSLRVQSVSDG